MSNKKLQKILDETAKIGGHTTEVNEGYQEIKEKMTDNLSTGNVPVADLNKASKLMIEAHKLAKKLPDAPQRKSSPINHCSSDMMHSQSWNQMRKRNKSALNMLGISSPLNKRGLWDNIHAKRKRGEAPNKPGDKGYPTDKALRDSQ